MANYEKQVEQEAAYPIPISLYNCYRTVRHEKRGIAIYILLISFLMPHFPVTVVQRYRDGVCSLLFHLFFIICHPYIPLQEMIFYTCIPLGNQLATCNSSPPTAPDEPNFLSVYSMEYGTDFAKQTPAINVMDHTFITELMRLICYNQPIYEDIHLELNEYAGLTLGVIDNDNLLTTVFTNVKPMYGQASIIILDNDSECIYDIYHNHSTYTIKYCSVVSRGCGGFRADIFPSHGECGCG